MATFRLAVIADAHFHDPAGDFGVRIAGDGKRLALRSWAETATAARAFNESAAALVGALERIVAAGVRHVVLAGDYTDDGQIENTRRLAGLLHHYRATHGLRFHALPGNHDFYAVAGKHVAARFLTGPGTTALVTSDPALAAATPGAVLSEAMRCQGLAEAMRPMAAFGLFRQPDHLHWESPFGQSDRSADRQFTATAADGITRHRLMDASYLIEPEPGLWLLMLDATVFEPRDGIEDPRRKRAFLNPADAGWNAALRIKPHLLDWIADVSARARDLGKVLVAVSHYPVLPPFAASHGTEHALFPSSTLARRCPGPAVGQALVDAGLRFHLGGHLHVNSRSEHRGLTDLSLPSITAFPPAFTVLTATQGQIAAETVSLADLPTDPELDALYQGEGAAPAPPEFGGVLAAQRRAYLRIRRLPRDLPPAVLDVLSGRDLFGMIALLTAEPARALAQRHGLALPELSALEVIADAVTLREAGALARLPPERIALCLALAADFGDPGADPGLSPAHWLARFLAVMAQAQVSAATASPGTCPGLP